MERCAGKRHKVYILDSKYCSSIADINDPHIPLLGDDSNAQIGFKVWLRANSTEFGGMDLLWNSV